MAVSDTPDTPNIWVPLPFWCMCNSRSFCFPPQECPLHPWVAHGYTEADWEKECALSIIRAAMTNDTKLIEDIKPMEDPRSAKALADAAKADTETAASKDIRACPWCARWMVKDDACNWVCCGEVMVGGVATFRVMSGCGNQWCFQCGKKLCGALWDPVTGRRLAGTASTTHTSECCRSERTFSEDAFCPGGHNVHVVARWVDRAPPAAVGEETESKQDTVA